MYIEAIVGEYKDHAELLAFCDSNQTRMDFYNKRIGEEYCHRNVPAYKAECFDQMIEEQKPDVVIVTTMDRTHHKYICRAMELGCDVVSEKPMTTSPEKCQQIIDVKKRTGKNLVVTFNYRYSPRNTKVKEVIKSGAIGKVTSVHFEWLLDTSHGADYFRRWHRDKNNSGGLMVHKATHHFDLVNWWLDDVPETVFAMGDLMFYGRENAEERGVTEFYTRARGSEVAAKDPFALKVDPDKDEFLMGLYYDAEHEDQYYRDQSVFGHGISIEDNMGVLVRYAGNTILTYSLNAHCPWEGLRVMFNGTKGRLEYNAVSKSYVSGDKEDFNQPGMREFEGDLKNLVPEIIFQQHFGKPQVIDYEEAKGGHGGGDVRLLNDIFLGVEEDSLGHAAGYVDGAKSILVGMAANKSMASGLAVNIKDLVNL
jgi:predicted dehydrogenase